jgi:hypothetical protein
MGVFIIILSSSSNRTVNQYRANCPCTVPVPIVVLPLLTSLLPRLIHQLENHISNQKRGQCRRTQDGTRSNVENGGSSNSPTRQSGQECSLSHRNRENRIRRHARRSTRLHQLCSKIRWKPPCIIYGVAYLECSGMSNAKLS